MRVSRGHHMQNRHRTGIAGASVNFRNAGRPYSLVEGWASLCRRNPKELGLLHDPYKGGSAVGHGDFPGLRASCRYGIHAQRNGTATSRRYYLENIPNPEGDVRAEIDRYSRLAGQADGRT